CQDIVEPSKIRPRLLGRIEKRRYHHQSAKIEIVRHIQSFDDCRQLALVSAGFSRLAGEINLNQHGWSSLRFARKPVEPLSQLAAIDRMNYIEGLDRLPSLVRLQMAYQVPSNVPFNHRNLG